MAEDKEAEAGDVFHIVDAGRRRDRPLQPGEARVVIRIGSKLYVKYHCDLSVPS